VSAFWLRVSALYVASGLKVRSIAAASRGDTRSAAARLSVRALVRRGGGVRPPTGGGVAAARAGGRTGGEGGGEGAVALW
jgi:hypothetical protein